MTLLKDMSSKSNWGGTEYGGTNDGTPALSVRLKEAAAFGSVTPPNGCTVLQEISVAGSDGAYAPGSTGWRTLSREHEPIVLRPIGFDSNMVCACWMPTGFPGDADMWVCPLEYHHTSPGGITGVVPAAMTMDGSQVRVRLWGGTTNASGAEGNPGHTVTLDNYYPCSTKNVWHVFVMRLKYGFQNNPDTNLRGAVEVLHGVPGDPSMTSLTGALSNINCGYGTLQYYPLFGLYRGQVGSSTTLVYTAGWKEYSTLAEAISWATVMIGGAAPPPPPPPPGSVPGVIHRPKLIVPTLETVSTVGKGLQ